MIDIEEKSTSKKENPKIEYYKASDKSPWVSVPRMTIGSMARFLLIGTWTALKWSDGRVEIR